MANLEASGRIYRIDEAQQITERFRKREFVLVSDEESKYPQHVLFQMTGDRCEQLDKYSEGDVVDVEFSLRGREWTSPKGEVRFFNSLEVWAVRGEASQTPAPPAKQDEPPPSFEDDDSIPF